MVYLILVSSILFLGYGCLVLSTDHMCREFERYGLSKFRTLTGILELLGGFGSLVGMLYPVILLLSSGGLSLLMFLGCITRIRARDPWPETIPALILMLLNGFIFFQTYQSFGL